MSRVLTTSNGVVTPAEKPPATEPQTAPSTGRSSLFCIIAHFFLHESIQKR